MISLLEPHIRTIVSGAQTTIRRPLIEKAARIQVGALLWVREPWAFEGARYDDFAPLQVLKLASPAVIYFATDHQAASHGGRRRFAREMPKALSRLTLEVTARREEQLQDIDEAGAIAEGYAAAGSFFSARAAFAEGWDTGRQSWLPGGGFRDRWADNPRVAVLTFVARHTNIDRLKAA